MSEKDLIIVEIEFGSNSFPLSVSLYSTIYDLKQTLSELLST
jgi:hypothetical protein